MLTNLLEYLKAFFYWLLTPLFDFIKFIAYYFYDKLCSLAEFCVSAISLPGELVTGFFNWAGLPDQLLYILNAIGLPTILTMLAGAYGVRFLLNLIPSWLTRV